MKWDSNVMIWGADYIFDVPLEEGQTIGQICKRIFGHDGWGTTYDFSRNQMQAVIYKHKLDERGKEGLTYALMAWKQVK